MFYGNATNTTNIAFQFDRIYETRYAMEQSIYGNDALGIKRDYIAPGRYVLVSYGYDKKINNVNGTVTTDDDFIRVYSNAINQDSVGKTNSIGNIDGTYFSQETGTFYSSNDCDPASIIKLATFTMVEEPNEENINDYYFERNGFYYKAHHFYDNEIYYTSNVSGSNQFVAKGQIVRRVANNIPANQQYVGEWEYLRTTDTRIISGKDYYVFSGQTNNYQKVTSPSVANIANYYERKNPTYLYTTNTRRNGYTEQFYICTGAVDNSQESDYTEGYYRYLQLQGAGDNALVGAAAFKPIALFTSIDDPYSQDYMDAYKEYTTPYLEHYNVDYAHFYALDRTWGTLHRGYDATVWQKVISEGVERYILIAHLNSLFPGLEIVQEPPTVEPISPFMGAESTDMIARLHIQTPWGFEVKSYDTSGMTPEEVERANFPSDETTRVKRFIYNPVYEEDPETHEQVMIGYETDEDGLLVHAIDSATGKYKVQEIEQPAYIYYNKAGLDKEIHSDESHLSNYISVTPTGQSLAFDSKYATSELKKKLGAAADIQQLEISLPAIGNMVSTGYDLLYGDGSDNLENKRHLDTQWYNASETSFIETGDSSVYSGGKTFDLNTLAGSLNTYHNRLGQIIETLNDEDWPSTPSECDALNKNYIYKYHNKYYKVGYNYSSQEITYDYYQCNYRQTNDTAIISGKTYYQVAGGEFVAVQNPTIAQLPNYYEWYDEVNEDSWSSGTYYVETTADNTDSKKFRAEIKYLNVNKYLVPYRPEEFSPGTVYYKRLLQAGAWFDEYEVIPYAPNQYYYRNGQSYVLEQDAIPQAGESIHYHIVETGQRQFTEAYAPGRFWVYDPLTGNYIKAMDDEANPNEIYYNINKYGTTFWDDPTGRLINTETQGRSFLPYLGNFYYYIVNINGTDFPVVDSNNIPGHPDAYKKTTDIYLDPNQTYYTYNASTGVYTEVTSPIAENLSNYYVRVIPDSYYYYELGDQPTLSMTMDGQLIVTYPVESQHEINPLAFGETRTINGVTYEPGISPMYYQNADGDFIKITLEFLKSRNADFFDLNYNEGRYGNCWFIKPVDITGEIFIPNVYWARNDENLVVGTSYQLATQAIYDQGNITTFYEITPYKVVQPSINAFYEQNKYFYKEFPEQDYAPILADTINPVMETVTAATVSSYNSIYNFGANLDMAGKIKHFELNGNYYNPEWLSNTLNSETYYKVKGQYYRKMAIAIETDLTGEAPPYYHWLEDYDLVPWKFNLVRLNLQPALQELRGFNNGVSSINGQILSLHNLLSLEDDYTRDTTTVQGALNAIEDKFYTLGEFTPGHIMYVNNYGRLTSSPLTHAELLASINNNGVNSINHTHSNKSELDLIQSGDVAKWNAKQNAIAANTYDSYGAASAAQTAAEAYADGLASNYEVAGAAAAIVGENTNNKTDLTLYGLLAYIQELEQRIAALEPTPEPEP